MLCRGSNPQRPSPRGMLQLRASPGSRQVSSRAHALASPPRPPHRPIPEERQSAAAGVLGPPARGGQSRSAGAGPRGPRWPTYPSYRPDRCPVGIWARSVPRWGVQRRWGPEGLQGQCSGRLGGVRSRPGLRGTGPRGCRRAGLGHLNLAGGFVGGICALHLPARRGDDGSPPREGAAWLWDICFCRRTKSTRIRRIHHHCLHRPGVIAVHTHPGIGHERVEVG